MCDGEGDGFIANSIQDEGCCRRPCNHRAWREHRVILRRGQDGLSIVRLVNACGYFRGKNKARQPGEAKYRSYCPAQPPNYWAGSGNLPRHWRCSASAQTTFRARPPCPNRWLESRCRATGSSGSFSMRRPCLQVIMGVNTAPPMASGNQPAANSCINLDCSAAARLSRIVRYQQRHGDRKPGQPDFRVRGGL